MRGQIVKRQPEAIEHPIIILVEGESDKRFIKAFIKYMNLDKIQVLSVNSKDNFIKGLRGILPHLHRIRCIGLIRDADEDPKRSFQSLCKALELNNLPIPSKPLKITGDSPSVSVLIIPSERPGSLETLCLESISTYERLNCIDEYLKCLRELFPEINSFTQAKLDKTKLYSFLATTDRPEIRLGEAAEANFFPFEAKSFNTIKDFLQNLYKQYLER